MVNANAIFIGSLRFLSSLSHDSRERGGDYETQVVMRPPPYAG
jgi:hypothetical protein